MVASLVLSTLFLFGRGCHDGHCPLRPHGPVVSIPIGVTVIVDGHRGHYDYVSRVVLIPAHYETDADGNPVYVKAEYQTRVERVWIPD